MVQIEQVRFARTAGSIPARQCLTAFKNFSCDTPHSTFAISKQDCPSSSTILCLGADANCSSSSCSSSLEWPEQGKKQWSFRTRSSGGSDPPKGPSGARVGPSPSTPKEGTVPNEDMVRALQLLQGVVTAEDFSKYEKMVSPPKKEEKVKKTSY